MFQADKVPENTHTHKHFFGSFFSCGGRHTRRCLRPFNPSLPTSFHPSSKFTRTLATKWISHLSSPYNWCHLSCRQNDPPAELHGVGACKLPARRNADEQKNTQTCARRRSANTTGLVEPAHFIHADRPPFRSWRPQLAPAQTSQAGRGRLPLRKRDGERSSS